MGGFCLWNVIQQIARVSAPCLTRLKRLPHPPPSSPIFPGQWVLLIDIREVEEPISRRNRPVNHHIQQGGLGEVWGVQMSWGM